MFRYLFVISKLPIPKDLDGLTLIDSSLFEYAPKDCIIDIVTVGTNTENEKTEFRKKMQSQYPAVDRIFFISHSLVRFARLISIFSLSILGIKIKLSFPGRASYRFDKYDAAYVSPLAMYSWLSLNMPIFANAVDSVARASHRSAEMRPTMLNRIKAWLLARWERKVMSDFDVVNLVSEDDLKFIRQRDNQSRITHISNAVDFKHFAESANNKPRAYGSILFTGNFDYGPNRIAAIRLAFEIYPRIRELEPQAILWLVGRNPPVIVQNVEGIICTGFVDDINRYYQAAEVYVCALTEGAGVKNKILEAMASGCSVVTSSVGAEGISGIQADEHFCLANNNDEFVKYTIELLHNQPKARSMASSARLVIESRADWRAVSGKYFDVLRMIAAQRHS